MHVWIEWRLKWFATLRSSSCFWSFYVCLAVQTLCCCTVQYGCCCAKTYGEFDAFPFLHPHSSFRRKLLWMNSEWTSTYPVIKYRGKGVQRETVVQGDLLKSLCAKNGILITVLEDVNLLAVEEFIECCCCELQGACVSAWQHWGWVFKTWITVIRIL